MNPVMIVNKSTGEIWRATSGKVGWKQPSHAKAAWMNSKTPCIPEHLIEKGEIYNKPFRFDEQDEYEVVFIDAILKQMYSIKNSLNALGG